MKSLWHCFALLLLLTKLEKKSDSSNVQVMNAEQKDFVLRKAHCNYFCQKINLLFGQLDFYIESGSFCLCMLKHCYLDIYRDDSS